MKYIDYKVQSVLLVVTFVLVIPLSIYGFMIGQLALGIWQMLSCMISVVASRAFRKPKLWHLGISLLFLTGTLLVRNQEFYRNDFIHFFLFFVPCWSLAIFYYVITWRVYHSRSERSKFLPNISF